jgi:hypothetical protein
VHDGSRNGDNFRKPRDARLGKRRSADTHLLDATWWFDDFTIDFFHEEMHKRKEQVVVCLGTPTLLIGGDLSRSNRRLILVDRDRILTEALQRAGYSDILAADLMRELPPCFSAGMVIADPPWYEAETQSFLAAAQSVSGEGAEIFISLPPFGTRPGIESERERLFGWCRQRGMALVALTPAATRYVCPPFERNVLRSTGSTSGVPNRVGDLARLRVGVSNDAAFHPAEKPPLWEEVTFGSTRFRLIVKPPVVSGDIRLIPMGWPEDIFPSCIRRHPERDVVDVWTSGNRAFRCHDTVGLSLFLRGLKAENGLYRANRKGLPTRTGPPFADQTAQQVLTILETEEKEYAVIRRNYV